MKGIRISEFGSVDVLQYVDLPEVEPSSGEVKVRLHAAGVNPADTYIRSGTYAFFTPELPYTPGFDGAGVVEDVGAGIEHLSVGDRVFVAALLATRNTGAYAQQMVCDADMVRGLPNDLSFAQGAAIGVPCATAWRALHQRARVVAGETVLVHGASGGVGIPTVQLARAHGLRVIGTAGSDEGLTLVRQAGAHHVLDHSRPDYLTDLPDLTGGLGVDVVIEMLADRNLSLDLMHVAKYGRVVVVGSRGSLDFTPRLTMIKEATILGMALWNTPYGDGVALTAGVGAALESGILKPMVGREMPLSEAARAHEEILGDGSKGKMVLTM